MTPTMKPLFATAVLSLLFAAQATPAAEISGKEISVAAPEVQKYLDSAFPQDYDALGGLLTLTARDPELVIPATGQRLQMSFSASASSPGRESLPVGRIIMSSSLRYDQQAHALYLDQPTLDDVQPTTPGQRVDEQTRMLVNLWLADYAGEEPLYQLEPAMVSALNGLNVESTRIENGRIVIRLNQEVGDLPAMLE